MQAAKNKYDTMVEMGKWNAPTAYERIVALQAQLTTFKKDINKKVVTFEKKKGGSNNNKTDDKGKKGKDDSHPSTWKAPKPGEKKEATCKRHTWYWCGKDTGGQCECW